MSGQHYASGSYQCVWLQDGVTYTMTLIGAGGDLFQMYKGSAAKPDSVTPSWAGSDESTKPVIEVVLMSSDATVTSDALSDKVNNAETKWFVGSDQLNFGNDGISIGTYAGLFKKIGAGDKTYPCGGLRILNNLVTAFGGVAGTIRCELAIEVTGNTNNDFGYIQASYPIRIMAIHGDSTIADIYCDSGQSFSLDENNTSVIAKLRVWRENILLETTDYTVKWFLMEGSEWVEKKTTSLTDKTKAHEFTVSRDDVATFGQIKAEAWSKDATPVLIASDMQTVSDSSDPYIIYPNPDPADGRLRQTGGPNEVTFEPKLARISGEEITGVSFMFAVLSPAGVIQNNANGDNTALYKSYSVPKTIFEKINAGPTVNITAVGD